MDDTNGNEEKMYYHYLVNSYDDYLATGSTEERDQELTEAMRMLNFFFLFL